MDPEGFYAMLDEQNGRCRICGQSIEGTDEKGKLLAHIDHDHDTGRVRGLLCQGCNTGLGMFKDSIRNLASAIVYLEEFGKTF
jgi:hypothetical protein